MHGSEQVPLLERSFDTPNVESCFESDVLTEKDKIAALASRTDNLESLALSGSSNGSNGESSSSNVPVSESDGNNAVVQAEAAAAGRGGARGRGSGTFGGRCVLSNYSNGESTSSNVPITITSSSGDSSNAVVARSNENLRSAVQSVYSFDADRHPMQSDKSTASLYGV